MRVGTLKIAKHAGGFTIVEVLAVIVVIGILAALVVSTFTGIQQGARNTERQTDIKAIHSQIESYYSKNGRYPTLTDLNTHSWRNTNLKGLDNEAVRDPKGTGTGAATSNSAPYQLGSTVAANIYAYVPTPSGCDNSATDCTGYTLTASMEGGGTFAKSALN